MCGFWSTFLKKKDSGLHSSENDMRLVIEKELHYILRISGPRLTGAACLGAYSGSSAITVPDGVLRVPSAAICFDLESHVLGTCEPQRLCVVLGACRKRRCGRGTEMTGTSERGGRSVQFGSYRAADRSKGGN